MQTRLELIIVTHGYVSSPQEISDAQRGIIFHKRLLLLSLKVWTRLKIK